MSDHDARAESLAWGWVAHLREGGTTPWLAWRGDVTTDPGHGQASSKGSLPGAQQLELLRRLNTVGTHDLADRVLTAPAAGRGLADLPLVDGPHQGWGAQPVDPATLSDRELLRVASVLLAQDLVALGPDPVEVSSAKPWRRRFRLMGDPLVVDTVARDLAARGRPQGGFLSVAVIAGAPLDQLLAHTWTQRCFERGTRPWEDWLRFWSERDVLPPRADLVAAPRRWGIRSPLVRVVTDPDRLPRALGVRRLPQVRVPGSDQAELARRVASVVGLMVPADERPALMRTLRLRMPDTATPPVSLPDWAREWVEETAGRMTRELRRADYPVVGDLADLTPRWDSTAQAGPRGAELDRTVLDLATQMLVDTTWRTPQARREGRDQ